MLGRYLPKDVASVTAGCANVLHVGRRVDLSVSLATLTVSVDIAGIQTAPGSCTSMTAPSSTRYSCTPATPAAGAVHSSERRAPPSIVRLLTHIHPTVLTKLTSCSNASTTRLPWLLYKPVGDGREFYPIISFRAPGLVESSTSAITY